MIDEEKGLQQSGPIPIKSILKRRNRSTTDSKSEKGNDEVSTESRRPNRVSFSQEIEDKFNKQKAQKRSLQQSFEMP